MDSMMKEGDSTLAAEAQEYCTSRSAIPVDLFANLVQSRLVYHFHSLNTIVTCVHGTLHPDFL